MVNPQYHAIVNLLIYMIYLKYSEVGTKINILHSQHFVEISKPVKLEPGDKKETFDIENLYSNVPVEESLQIFQQNKLTLDGTFFEWLSVKIIKNLLFCGL